MLLIALAIGYSLYLTPNQQQMVVPGQGVQMPFEAAGSLTLLDQPQYAHEYPTRAQVIHNGLAMLREKLGADRAYVLVYEKNDGVSGEYDIAHVFEVVGEELRPHHQHLLGTMLAADQVSDIVGYDTYEQLSYMYGKALYDSHNRVIGYFGIDASESFALLQTEQAEHVRKTIAMIEATLSQT